MAQILRVRESLPLDVYAGGGGNCADDIVVLVVLGHEEIARGRLNLLSSDQDLSCREQLNLLHELVVLHDVFLLFRLLDYKLVRSISEGLKTIGKGVPVLGGEVCDTDGTSSPDELFHAIERKKAGLFQKVLKETGVQVVRLGEVVLVEQSFLLGQRIFVDVRFSCQVLKDGLVSISFVQVLKADHLKHSLKNHFLRFCAGGVLECILHFLDKTLSFVFDSMINISGFLYDTDFIFFEPSLFKFSWQFLHI